MSLADVNLHSFGFSSFSFCGNELKNICDITDTLAPVSNSSVVVHCCTVMKYSALIPSDKASLMITSISSNSQSKLEDIKSEYLLKRLSKSSSSV